MTYRMALKVIRRHSRKGDGLEETFKAICRNRWCHPIREWAIYDLHKARNKTKFIDQNCVKRLYDRHLARLGEIFRVRHGDYL